MSITCVGLTDNQFLVQSHIGQIIFSSTLDTEDKVKQLYGGNKWVKIEGKFLLGASDKYVNGDIGGEETHVLTINESPSHTHNRGTMNIHGSYNVFWSTVNTLAGAFYGSFPTRNGASVGSDSGTQYYDVIDFDAARNWTGETSSVGDNQPHNNMPPFRTVYIWERTA